MKKLLLLIPVLFIGLAVYYFLRIDPTALESYIGNWLETQGVSVPDLECQMNKVASRTGFCTFSLKGQNIATLKTKLRLKEGGSLPFRSEGCGRIQGLSGAKSYVTEADPGPIFPDNSRSSLNRILYSESQKVFCLDVEFPFG